MNSQISLINFKYMMENIKKSKGLLILVALLIPVFTGLFLVLLTKDIRTVVILSIGEISIPAIIGLYILPIVVSISLFGFVHKKNRVDMIGSMPLKRNTIFFTNTLAGIILFALTLGISAIIISIISLISENIVIPVEMLFVYFGTFLASYTFVFTVSNLAMTLTGSVMIQVLLTFFLLFFPGYMQDLCVSKQYDYNMHMVNSYSYYPPTVAEREFGIVNSIYINNSHTLPYKFARIIPLQMFNMSSHIDDKDFRNIYSTDMMIKTILFGAGYFAVRSIFVL